MRRNTFSAISVILLIFLLGFVGAIRPAKAQETFVKVYVNQPLGYIPFVAPGSTVTIEIMIETSNISDGTEAGIVGWGLNVQVDPNVLDINLTAPPPPPFPPPPPPAKIIGAQAGYFLYEFAQMASLPDPTLMAGSSDPSTGYWTDIAETIMPTPATGAGDYTSGSYPNLVTLNVTSKSETQPCLIDLVSGYYKDGYGNVYPADILVDGYYGSPPPNATFTYTPSEPLMGELVTFNASASEPDGGTIVSYAWDFGDDTTKIYRDANLTAITNHTYTLGGIYSVTLNVTNDKGLWDTESQGVTVYGPPVANFTFSPAEPLVGELVTFNASASYDPDGGDIVSYEWDFGDETTDTENITTHAYSEAGTYAVTLNVTNDKGLWDTESKNVTVYGPPVASFTYSPSDPSVGEPVTFNASASYDPDGGDIVSYEWDFGDETLETETDPIITHKFFVAGTYTISLNVTDDEGSTSATSDTVTVSGAAAAAELDVEVEVGSIHFRGESAEFYILTSFMGEPVNTTQINARLYYGGALHEDLSGSIENVTTGLYRVPYPIPQDAPAGTYVLVVNATFFTQKGVSLKSFLISSTLTGWNALLININETAGTIKTSVGLIEVKLDSINATLTNIDGTVATINTTIGSIAADTSTINATLTGINGTLVTIDSTLGTIQQDITAINGQITDIDGTLVTIQTSIGSIEADIDDINGEISDIDGILVTIQTSMGSIETNATAINALVADVQNGLVTIDSTLGDIQLDLDDLGDDISLKLVSVQGDIDEGVANITAALTDAEGNILAELGEVEVKLEDINAALINVDGSLVTIGTDIGNIEGAITSIQGDVATIETDIGVIIAILEEWTGVTTSSITTPVGTFDIMVLTNSTLEDPVSFSDSTLTLVVRGEAGTTGTLSVMIPKQLLVGIGSNIDEFAVTINNSPVSFTYTEEAELYTVRIMYTHSIHTIRIHMAGLLEQPPLALWILLTIVLATATTAIGAALYTQKTQKKPAKPQPP